MNEYFFSDSENEYKLLGSKSKQTFFKNVSFFSTLKEI